MAGKTYRWTPERKAEVEQALRSSSSRREAAQRLGIGIGALDHACDAYGFQASILLHSEPREAQSPEEADRVKEQVIRELREQVRKLERSNVTEERVLQEIIELKDSLPEPPEWLIETQRTTKGPGVPAAMATDWHGGEVVDPAQIGGMNEYNVEILRTRARAFFSNTIDLLKNHMVCPKYPGIVLVLGGDMVSGEIHPELAATNDLETMPAVLEVWGLIAAGIKAFREAFGHVYVVGVTGNHGRSTQKPVAKGRAYGNYDWLIYQFLQKRFEEDERVKFNIPSGPDASFQLYGTRYLLTHGDQFRGGDGMIGALGPIIRGDHKKRSRNGQIGQDYDTLLLGHWHQLIQMQRLIVGGTLKGYDEFAYSLNVPYEPPRQALWITHPTNGITFSMPILLDKPRAKRIAPSWVSWQSAA